MQYHTSHRAPPLDLMVLCTWIINKPGSGDSTVWEREGGGTGILTTHATREMVEKFQHE